MSRLALLPFSCSTALLATIWSVHCPAADNSSTPRGPAPFATVAAVAESLPSADDDANDVALWVHPEDPARSLLLLASGTAGLETYDLQGKRLGAYPGVELDHIDVAYGFALQGRERSLLVGYDRSSGGLLTFTLDAGSGRVAPAGATLSTHTEITGLCLYRSPISGTQYAFASSDEGLLQQWQLFDEGGKVTGALVRSIPVGVGSTYCAADEPARQVYVAEESVGVWRFDAEPETEAVRSGVTYVRPLGPLEEEVKGLAIYKTSLRDGYLIVSDVAAQRFNVHSLQDASLLGSFALAGKSIDAVDDAEGLAASSLALSPALPGGLLAVVDTKNDGGANIKIASWSAIAQALGLSAAGDGQHAGMDPRSVRTPSARTVVATVETEPVRNFGDAADDPAIWVHPSDPARSLIIGTNKKRGLEVYDLSGKRVQTLDDGRMNNVDLRQGFRLAGKDVAIAAATNRTDKTLALYAIDAQGRLRNVADGKIPTGLRDPYGLCMYHSANDAAFYVFANDANDGAFRQWRLLERNGRVGARLVREFAAGSQAEGCVADDETGQLYVAEEDVGLWRYSAEPDGGAQRTLIDSVEGGRLVDDVEGVGLYRAANGTGYIVVSSQGSDNYVVYRREGSNEHVGTFHVIANDRLGIDGVSETDGLEVTSTSLGAAFPHGLFVAQDGRNITPNEPQNFKLVPWERIAEALGLPLP